MKRRNLQKFIAIELAFLFGVFLLFGTLSSSDFVRGIYKPPTQSSGVSWQDVDTLGINVTWTNAGTYSNLDDLVDTLNTYDIQVILKKWGYQGLGYLLQYYSNSQYMRYEVDVENNPEEAVYYWNLDGTGYYFFDQAQGEDDPNMPPDPDEESWFLDHETDSAGTVIYGPYYTPSGHFLDCEWYPGMFNFYDSTAYRHRISAAADLTGLSPGTNIFKLFVRYLYRYPVGDSTGIKTVYAGDRRVAAGDFSSSLSFEEFSFPPEEGVGDTIYLHWPAGSPESDTIFAAVLYQLHYYDNCDLWVDWVEVMDKDIGYYLFVDDASQDSILGKIVDECEPIEDMEYGDVIIAWKVSDEPKRLSWPAHSVVTDTMIDHGLSNTRTPVRGYWTHRRYDTFVSIAKPVDLMEHDTYVFMDTGSSCQLGAQFELDTLAFRNELAYQACQNAGESAIDMYFMGQVAGGVVGGVRNPTRSEILAQTYIALAHGAKGISYYKYDTWTAEGLVNANFEIFPEKYYAVQEVFTQLDSIGGTLENLVRDTAYCVEVNPAFQSPITQILFCDDSQNEDYIEVGQFHHETQADTFLILVNRRTNYDRHITVKTNKSGNYTLKDLYTQENFISSTGDFHWIPFDSGEGRVFQLKKFENMDWSDDDHVVLADTYDVIDLYDETTLTINAGTTVKATENGMLYLHGGIGLDCNGAYGDSVTFTALEEDQDWKGILFNRAGPSSPTDTLEYTKVEKVDTVGGGSIRMYCGSRSIFSNCRVSSNC